MKLSKNGSNRIISLGCIYCSAAFNFSNSAVRT